MRHRARLDLRLALEAFEEQSSRAGRAKLGCADAAKRDCGDAVVLSRMVFKDTLGNRTDTTYSDWQRNPRLGAEEFRFTPPAGVDVIGEIKPEAEVHPIKD